MHEISDNRKNIKSVDRVKVDETRITEIAMLKLLAQRYPMELKRFMVKQSQTGKNLRKTVS